MMELRNRCQAWWSSLPSEHRSRLWKVGLGIISVVLISGVYVVSGEKAERESNKPEEKARAVKLGDDLLADDVKAGILRDRNEEMERDKLQDEQIQILKKLAEQLQAQQLDGAPHFGDSVANGPTVPGVGNFSPGNAPTIRYPAAAPGAPFESTPLSAAGAPEPAVEVPKLIGGISHVEAEDEQPKKDEGAKKKKSVFLPPSLMEAVLLTGMDAFTAEGAKEHPQPMMLRVQAPAVLPNYVKADLKGCFVIADGWGSLAAERIETEVVSLHCISQNGEAVIDQKIRGYLTDTDGKQGLKGIVVTKAGAHVMRTFIAGVFGGIGGAVQLSGTTTSVSPLGATQVLDPNRVATAGVGQGIKDASMDLRKFFLDLAKQSAPVIEMGAAKKVGVVITEGVELEIKEHAK